MKIIEILQVLVFLAILLLLTPILGRYMADVFLGKKHVLSSSLGWLERAIYQCCNISPEETSNWKTYTLQLLFFNFLGFLVVFLLQIFQAHLPLNPQHFSNVSWDLAFNTAISFMTNTNWQSYAGETTLSYLVQVLGLTVQNFLSAATGIAVLLALIRGIRNRGTDQLGNFWVDVTRSVVYVFLPLSIVMATVFISQGVVQNFSPAQTVETLERESQTIPMGPAASQIAIKQLGTNGGGFLNTNSSHPFENPTPLSNLLQLIAILLIPFALTYTFGVLIRSRRHGLAIFMAMFILYLAGLGVSLWSELGQNPALLNTSFMEGKETRLGIVNSILWSVSTTAASNGSVNAMHSSLSPLAGGIALLNIMLGEVVFGGVGAGLYGMLMFVLLTVFLCGLMVGRTPEYFGKKIEAPEMILVILAILIPNVVILLGAGISVILPMGLSSISHAGPHGLSEMLYAWSSAAGNNGSAFAGLQANTPYYNVGLGLSMLIGRFSVMIPVLAVAGHLSSKKVLPLASRGFRLDTPLFVFLLIAVILMIGALTFFPALSLGPVMEHLLMKQGVLF
ncbi:MAG: potassium-transporting ATPase subunit KdpA [Deltaproteobacteria bacterium]|nr:potassium-transporting ATPase subunit KdpA [Deltaproteobacteria bacterium]